MRKLLHTAVMIMLALLSGDAAWAQSKVGSTVGAFLRIEPGARGAALGNAGVALPDGIDAVYYNTGAIGLLDHAAVQYTHSMWFADISFDYVAFALPVTGTSTLFASMTALNSGEIDVRTVDQPLGTGERYDVANVALGLGYGRRITSRFAVGLQANYATERIWHTSNRILTFNVGTVYRLNDAGAILGFSLANLGPRARYSGGDLAVQFNPDPDQHGNNSALPAEQYTDEFPLPGVFRLGISVPYDVSASSRLLFLAEALHPNDNSESANLGVEWTWSQRLALRVGYQTLFQEEGEQGLTAGFGVEGPLGANRYHLSYAWAGHDHLQDTHRITLVLRFR
ncbi:MAG: PorV/PorQ family protein [Candidatus Krumholzibacteria bacterium]|jgi:hypothetical protein|nr:PorV/PorQ family protein [Candidatus Krumholzibacteria bacterium]